MFVSQTKSAIIDSAYPSRLARESVETGQIYKLFGQRVARARAMAQLTQSQLGERVGLSRASIANIEAGRQRVVLHQALEIAEAIDAGALNEILLVDVFRPAQQTGADSIRTTGAHLSDKEVSDIARIVASS